MARVVEWVVTAVAAIAGGVLFEARGAVAAAGSVVEVPISLVPGDVNELACGLSQPVSHYRCTYVNSQTRGFPPPARKDTLYPVNTTDGAQYLVGGLFDEEGVREHIRRTWEGKRFTARCQLRLLEKVDLYETRFGRAASWGAGRTPIWVGEPVSCRIE